MSIQEFRGGALRLSCAPIFLGTVFAQGDQRLRLQDVGPSRFEDQDADRRPGGDYSSRVRSYKVRNAFVNFIDRSRYFSYDFFASVAVAKNRTKYDEPAREADGFDNMAVVVRPLVGFTEYGRPL